MGSWLQYDLKDFDVAGRLGVFKVGDRVLETPNLFPVVSPFENAISPRRMFDHFGVQALFTNAYIIYQHRAAHPEILEKGLHTTLDFPGLIATDSGGFQDYMYGGDLKISPEEIEPFQEQIGSDCPVILDIPVQITDSYDVAKYKVDITLQRSKANIARRSRSDTAWFGPIHGSIYSDLLQRSTEEMSSLDFGIYAIGGVVKTFIDYRFDLDVNILLQVKQWINPNRPLHMFGLGLPSFFALAVACGADTFDSAAYYLYAKDNRYFTLQGTKKLEDLTELPCHCPICTRFNVSELQKLDPIARTNALAEHNLYLSMSELKTVRQAIREGNLWELVENRAMAHPKFIQALRATRNFLPVLEQFTPAEKPRGLKYLSEHSFYRPEIYRYLQKIPLYQVESTINQYIFIPELDVPAFSSPSSLDWIPKIRKKFGCESAEIVIISNLFGPIPLELAETYPVSQHEGSPILDTNQPIAFRLLDCIRKWLQNQSQSPAIANFYIPTTYYNEYNERVPFDPSIHLISQLAEHIKRWFPDISINQINSIS
jgi:7-cyano-7-deazaguanine tRNA-ribosyltransferase